MPRSSRSPPVAPFRQFSRWVKALWKRRPTCEEGHTPTKRIGKNASASGGHSPKRVPAKLPHAHQIAQRGAANRAVGHPQPSRILAREIIQHPARTPFRGPTPQLTRMFRAPFLRAGRKFGMLSKRRSDGQGLFGGSALVPLGRSVRRASSTSHRPRNSDLRARE